LSLSKRFHLGTIPYHSFPFNSISLTQPPLPLPPPLLSQADKLSTLVKAAGVEVEPVWFSLYAKALAGQDLTALLLNIGSAGAAAPAAGGAAAAAGGAAEEAAAEEKEEEKEESDEDMGFGTFTIY
jgi:large subunit ribosomal protein LP1